MAKELDKKVVFVEDSWATMVAGLQAGRYDVTMPIAKSPARAAAADFTSPLMKIMIGFAVLKENADKYKNWQDLNKPNIKITTTLGSSVHINIEPRMKGRIDLMLVKSSSESIAQLLTHRADAWANTYEAFIHVEKKHANIVTIPGDPIAVDQLAIAVAKGNSDTIARIDAFMKKMRDSGELLKIAQRYGMDERFLVNE